MNELNFKLPISKDIQKLAIAGSHQDTWTKIFACSAWIKLEVQDRRKWCGVNCEGDWFTLSEQYNPYFVNTHARWQIFYFNDVRDAARFRLTFGGQMNR